MSMRRPPRVQTPGSRTRPPPGAMRIEFDRIVAETGGTRIRASGDAYGELLNHLRGFYVVGYYVQKDGASPVAEITEHAKAIRAILEKLTA